MGVADPRASEYAREEWTFSEFPEIERAARLQLLLIRPPRLNWSLYPSIAHALPSRAKIVPPRSQVGAITPDQRKQIINSSVLAGHYEKAIDRESAYEKLQARAGEKTQSAGAPPVTGDEPTTERPPQSSVLAEALGTVTAAFQPTIGPRGAVHDSFATSMAKSAMRAASSQSAGKSLAACLAESSAAAEDGGSLSVILSEAKNLRFISLHERD